MCCPKVKFEYINCTIRSRKLTANAMQYYTMYIMAKGKRTKAMIDKTLHRTKDLATRTS